MDSSSRFQHIDALRGIAALLVAWLHICEVYINLSPEVKTHGTSLYDIAWFIHSGRVGVIIFFGISGFVLIKSISGNRKFNATKKFLIRRFFRLYPAFWISVFLGFYSMSLIGQTNTFETILANLTMLPQFFKQPMILGLYWTLETEMCFYFITLLLFLCNKLDSYLNLFLASLFFWGLFVIFYCLSKIFCLINFEHIGHVGLFEMPLFLSIMFWGGLFRGYYDDRSYQIIILSKKVPINYLLSILTILILVIPTIALIKGLLNNDFYFTQLGISYVIGMASFVILSNVIKIKTKFMVWIGTISYSFYLFHPIVFYSFFWWFKNKAPSAFKGLHLSIYLLINIIFTIIISAVIYYCVEKKCIKLAHRLTSEIR